MIGSVRGVLRRKRDMQVDLETAGGVGYELAVAQSLVDGLPAEGEEVHLLTHLVVRDNAMELFGFQNEAQKRQFLQLIAISGVGPRSALAVLSILSPDLFHAAIAGSDEKALARAQGVGKRTAQRIIVELQPTLGVSASVPGGGGAVSSPRAEACAALEGLSFSSSEAAALVRDAINHLGDSGEGGPLPADDLVREALRLAGRGKAQ